MVIFNWKPKDLEFYKLNKHNDEIYKSKQLYNGNGKGLWGKGFCTVTDLNYNTACYVARYCTKKAGLNKQFKIPLNQPKIDDKGVHTQYFKNKNKPLEMYINMSTGVGIGLQYWIENMDFLKKWQYITLKINDKIVNKRLPRYFKKKWNKQDWESYEQAKYENFIKSQELKKELIKQDNYGELYTDEEKWKMHLKKIDEKLHKHCSIAGILSRNDIELTDEENQSFTSSDCSEIVTKRNQDKQYTDSERRWKRILTRWSAEDYQNEINPHNFKNIA